MPQLYIRENLVLCIIVLACIKFTSGVEHKLDVGLYDESYYLYNGVTVSSNGFPEANNAPLYSLWYYILSFAEPDRIALYFLNFKLMAILPPLLFYILLRRKGGPLLISSITTLIFLISQANLPTWPKVSHFALILMLGALILITRVTSNLVSTAIALVGALLMAYVRPEYFLSFSIFAFAFIIVYAREQQRLSLVNTGAIISVISISAALIGTLGAPLSGGRSIFAFGQHFSLNWVAWTDSALNPWTNWEAILERNFGPVQSIPEAFGSNPALFTRHITSNCLKLIQQFPAIFFYHSNILLPPTRTFSLIEAVVVFALCIGFIIKSWPKNVKAVVSTERRFFLFAGIYAFTGMVSSVVIYPRDHYLLLPLVLTVLLMAIISTKQHSMFSVGWPKQLALIALAGVLVLILTPRFADQVAPPRENLATIQTIKSLQIDEQVTILEAQGGFNIYAGDNFRRMREFEKDTPFNRFLLAQDIGVIVLSDTLSNDVRFKQDTEWQSFLVHYQQKGFDKIPVPESQRTLFVRKDLLQK
jgi:hypothetical protein